MSIELSGQEIKYAVTYGGTVGQETYKFRPIFANNNCLSPISYSDVIACSVYNTTAGQTVVNDYYTISNPRVNFSMVAKDNTSAISAYRSTAFNNGIKYSNSDINTVFAGIIISADSNISNKTYDLSISAGSADNQMVNVYTLMTGANAAADMTKIADNVYALTAYRDLNPNNYFLSSPMIKIDETNIKILDAFVGT